MAIQHRLQLRPPTGPRTTVERGAPKTIVSDNGTELTSNAVLAWSGETGNRWHYIAPGKPTHNGFVESFNGRMRDYTGRPLVAAG